ncbi:hypothetical protein BX661DRAFT_195578 [Kickxella alabastrina]|uniref:uncharacterized protein n=1 Tax=Kickxella alabastrina TaxID=61397 RepID=UPI00221FD6AF|nr:uncharacterized protein BX661DRAFT_195578 [Kickxella alabastrina]KAI7835023.1 hypothetical protein BX661DRAFT_195578 [Kickxella alabastrina]
MSAQQNSSAMDTKPDQSTPSIDPAAAQQKLTLAGALEEDDEFEEFDDKEDVTLWDDNWDDDDLEDDFSKQLRVELERASNPEPMSISS